MTKTDKIMEQGKWNNMCEAAFFAISLFSITTLLFCGMIYIFNILIQMK